MERARTQMPTSREQPEWADDLIERAITVLPNAYSRYSKFSVGAAALARSGQIYTGVNVENTVYGLSVCAERVAIWSAVANLDRDIVGLAVVSGTPIRPEMCFPCGACRQVLAEFSNDRDKTLVVTYDAEGRIVTYSANDLLPFAFDLSLYE
jgi:cytidine deaminase